MAKQRWATFSVADHQDVVQLVPDILTFDRLVFPYPSDQKEWDDWEKNGWNPKLLDTRLVQLGSLATIFEWGEPERTEYRTQLAAVRNKDRLGILPAPVTTTNEILERHRRWEVAKQATRDTIGARIKYQYGDDCWLLPRYGSLAALQAERSFNPPTERESRRARLTVLLGHELELPASAHAEKAYELALELAKDSKFQQARRELNTKQEMMVIQEQSGKNDAQEFADLVSTFNTNVRARSKETRKGWIFTLLKASKEIADIVEKPFSSIFGAALEITETATEEEAMPAGPIAVFHHTKKRVFDPAR